MKFTLVFLTIFSTFVAVFSKNCNNPNALLYKDLNCTPHYDNEATERCPKKYSCAGLEPWTDKCHFRGKTYKNSESVPINETKPHCLYCHCDVRETHAEFVCAYEDCFAESKKAGCKVALSLDRCCAFEDICPPFETCEVDGRQYQEGYFFYPKNTCLRCICKKGFNGKFEEPFCVKTKCAEQLLHWKAVQDRCAPVYETSLGDTVCCPNRWICPDGTEQFEEDTEGCKFGDRIVKKGQKFVKFGKHNKQVTCECLIPPLLTCM